MSIPNFDNFGEWQSIMYEWNPLNCIYYDKLIFGSSRVDKVFYDVIGALTNLFFLFFTFPFCHTPLCVQALLCDFIS